MDVNQNVVSQGIVLASVLAGFSLTIIAQIALTGNDPGKYESVVVFLLATSFGCIATVLLGMAYLGAVDEQLRHKFAVTTISLIVVSISLFLISVMMISHLSDPAGVGKAIGTIVIVLGLIVLFFSSIGQVI